MNEWLKISLLLCVFGFLKEIRPSEPFIYEYLIGPWKDVTPEQVTQEIYPVGIYSNLAQLVIVFLITDLCRYKPLIVVLGLSGVVVWSMLLWTRSLIEQQILEVFYGTFVATEVAYYTYIYAKVEQEHYQQVTSYTRAAILAGRAVSGVLAQILFSLEWMDLRQLNYITLTAMILATLWSILLPSVQKSIYFHQIPEYDEKKSLKYRKAFNLMKVHFVTSFTNKHVIKWSVWWALATCGFLQCQYYMQPLWSEIVLNDNAELYNGAVEALLTFIGFLTALLAGVMNVDWKQKGELVLSISSILEGVVLLISSQTTQVVVSYVCYVALGGLFHYMITIASSEIAKYIKEDSYGLVFGFNTLIALVLQSILTLIVVNGDVGFGLKPREQYLVYGLYHLFIATVYIAIGLGSWIKSKKDIKKTYT